MTVPFGVVVARGALAGFAGTSVMTLSYAAEREVRKVVDRPLDYDDGPAPAEAVRRLFGLPPLTEEQSSRLKSLVLWGYGSAVGVGHALLLRRWDEPGAGVGFFAGISAMAFALLPVLGGTPPPWKWPADIMATSIAQHAVYALTVAAVDR